MAIRAVIFDISGTLLNRQGKLVPGTRALISQLQYWKIDVFFATNDPPRAALLQSMLDLPWSKFLLPGRVGGKKGTNKFIAYVSSSLEIPPNAMLYVGDALHDFHEALSGKLLFFSATWANPTLAYGIPVHAPAEFLAIVHTFFLAAMPWHYRIDEKDGLGREVVVRALLASDLSKIIGLTPFVKSNGSRQIKPISGFQSDRYLLLHLLANMYLEGLHLPGGNDGSIWCLYPGHDGQYGLVLDNLITLAANLFCDRYQRQLLVRHTVAPSSSQMRISHGIPTVDIQLQTIYLDPALRAEIMHRRVIVVDDFTTDAYGFETARNFLLNAGAGSVISLAVAKYGSMYNALSPRPGIHWDSFLPASLCSEHFSFTGMAG